jgi:hypothetical protein
MNRLRFEADVQCGQCETWTRALVIANRYAGITAMHVETVTPSTEDATGWYQDQGDWFCHECFKMRTDLMREQHGR